MVNSSDWSLIHVASLIAQNRSPEPPAHLLRIVPRTPSISLYSAAPVDAAADSLPTCVVERLVNAGMLVCHQVGDVAAARRVTMPIGMLEPVP